MASSHAILLLLSTSCFIDQLPSTWSSETKEIFYQKRAGIQWDNCPHSLLASVLKCAVQCQSSRSCQGFNIEDDTSTCYLCSSDQTNLAITPSSTNGSSSSTVLYFSFNSVIHRIPPQRSYNIHFPHGLYDNQAIWFRARPQSQRDRPIIVFAERSPFIRDFSGTKGEADLYLEINFVTSQVMLNTYNSDDKSWRDSHMMKGIGDFLQVGVEADVVIIVNEAKYTVYMGGRLFVEFSRRSGLTSIKDVKAIEMSADFPYVYVRRRVP